MTKTRKLLGPHLAGSWTSNLDILRTWQPRLVLVLQPEVDKVQQVREACPDAIVVGRFFHDDSHYASNIAARPKEFAGEIHQEIANNPVTPLLDYAQSNNEVCQSWDTIGELNEYSLEWMNLADQSQAYKCAILAFSVGNPDMPYKPGDPAGFDGRMLYWQQVLPSLNYAQANSHILLLHAYGYPTMFDPDADWYIYRYERQVQANLKTLGITNLKYAYGEIGIDRLIVNGKGGYKVITNDQDYTNQLLQWERDLQDQGLLLGGTIFTFGDSGGWDTYDITSTNVASMIATHYADHAGDYDTPDSSPDEDGNVLFIPLVSSGEQPVSTPQPLPPVKWDERLTQRGIELTQYRPQPGEWYWRITEGQYWEEKEHTFAVTLDQNGVRKPGVAMRFWNGGNLDKRTELKPNDRWMVDFPMFAHGRSYGLKALDGPSDSVFGMGLGSVEQPDWNIHVSYWFEFKWTQAPAADVPAPPATTPPPQPKPRFDQGDTLYTGGYVNLRRSPGYSGKPASDVINVLEPGTSLKLAAGPEIADGLVWWRVIDHFGGWVAESDPTGSVLLSEAPPPPASNIPILLHPIEDPALRVLTQPFGVNEAFYKQFLYDGVPLMGHNGVDYGIPVGTSIRAVDDGKVLEIKNEPGGFGIHLLVRHSWGDSVYAHLSTIIVAANQEVQRGQPIALSGNTGLSTGPHLHFGIRFNGYNRKDGYGGYDDPLPYFVRTAAATNLREIIESAAKEFGIDPDLMLSLCYAESRFSASAKSSAGALGLAQIMPPTWAEWSPRVGAKNILNPADNARVGAAYLAWLLKQFNGNVIKALYAYNWGIGRVRNAGMPPVTTQIYAYSIVHGSEFEKALRKL